ncbi:baseplate megatron protein TIM-barrel domain-containing protein [Candidatus Fokinia crypta]|uniref:Phage tail protein n=1 Tax=Candidatus Fokinia crypta TaxID=1920990 RepID=A0ABZ0UPF9_9RICK|nr:glycoside hydrolase TIM-barrel-like domain-containing protein [Candidatus Fokinia cryptica]WPX97782.1 Putative phage tail protein [Candidatus Fokinia cryptica]
MYKIFNRILNRFIGATLGKHLLTIKSHLIDPLINSYNKVNSVIEHLPSKNIPFHLPQYKQIPIVYGRYKLECSIIWMSGVTELRNVEYHNGVQNIYAISFAAVICQGPINSIGQVWINGSGILYSQYTRIRGYYGTEDQMPDPLLQRIHGVNSTSAHRGLAYIVFENFIVPHYNYHIPKVEVEVLALCDVGNEISLRVKSINLVPGYGEFVYDTVVQSKIFRESSKSNPCQREEVININQHHTVQVANVIIALEDMARTLPNVKWVSVIVNWFATTYDTKDAAIKPGVEFKSADIITSPDLWSVCFHERNDAELIKRDQAGKLIYGGTPSDISVIRLVRELKSRQYKVMINPTLLVNENDKPWRGKMICDASNLEDFFNKSDGYNNFIAHYARILGNSIDAFLIGSELVSIMACRNDDGDFVAVKEMKKLAANVRKILPSNVLISYAAHWLEYHHTDEGWYHLDDLWSDPNINFIGINNYMPLIEEHTSNYDVKDIIKYFDSGEGYDYLYERSGTYIDKITLSKEYAWKNIEWWWSNLHRNPNDVITSWVPKSKKIWFTEYGFPSMSVATNRPNMFLEPDSENFYRDINFLIQKSCIVAMEERWQNSECVENLFLCAWDARPYPTWPVRYDVWSDTDMWEKGYCVQGKLGMCSLGTIMNDLCLRTQLSKNNIVTSNLIEEVDGFAILQNLTCEEIIHQLKEVFLFEIVEDGYSINFISRRNTRKLFMSVDYLLQEEGSLKASKLCEFNDVQQFEFSFMDMSTGYDGFVVSYISESKAKQISVSYATNIVISRSYAKHLLENIIKESFVHLKQYEMRIGLLHHIIPSDILIIKIGESEVWLKVLITVMHNSCLHLFCHEERIVKNSLLNEH